MTNFTDIFKRLRIIAHFFLLFPNIIVKMNKNREKILEHLSLVQIRDVCIIINMSKRLRFGGI